MVIKIYIQQSGWELMRGFRPVVMTALMAAVGLLPAAISHGIGSESSRPLARVVIGGIICAMFFSLLIFPHLFAWAYRKFDVLHKQDESLDTPNL